LIKLIAINLFRFKGFKGSQLLLSAIPLLLMLLANHFIEINPHWLSGAKTL
jgi:hypothetical protein